MYDKPDNQNFENKLEKVHYKGCVAVNGAIQGTSRLYDKLGLKSLSKRPSLDNYPVRSVSAGKLKPSPSRSKSFEKTFFPYCIDEWNKLNTEVRNANLYKNKKNKLKLKNFKILYLMSMILLG